MKVRHLTTELGTVWVAIEKRLKPVEYVVGDAEHGLFGKKCAVPHTIKSFREVKSVYNNIWIGIKEAGDSVKEVDERCSCWASWLKSELIFEIEKRRGRTERRINEVSYYNALKDFREDWCDGNWPKIWRWLVLKLLLLENRRRIPLVWHNRRCQRKVHHSASWSSKERSTDT